MGKTFAVEKRAGEDGRSRLVVTYGRHVGDPAASLERLEGEPRDEVGLEGLADLGVRVGFREANDGIELVFYRDAQGAKTDVPAAPATPAAPADPCAGFTDNERKVYELVRERGEISALDATNALGMTPRGGIRLLTGLVHKGVLVYEGAGTKKKYHLAQ